MSGTTPVWQVSKTDEVAEAMQAVQRMAAMVAAFYSALVKDGVEPAAALVLTDTYTKGLVSGLMAKAQQQ